MFIQLKQVMMEEKDHEFIWGRGVILNVKGSHAEEESKLT
jgi:hypothetical protein